MKPLFTALAIGFISLCSAGNVPVEWTADVDSLAVHEFAARRGETLDLAVKLTYHGKPFAPEGDWEIFYQTNGMGSAYFTFPVAVEGNVARVTFTPAMDPGAERLVGFIGRRGVNYRAAFALRFYGSPGATPNALTLPTKTIDFAQLEVHNAPWITAADIGNKRSITDLTVYGKDVAKPYALADECRPFEVTVNGTTYNLDKISLEWSEEYDSVCMFANTGKLGDFYGDAIRIVFSDGVAETLNTQWDDHPQWRLEYRFGGRPYEPGVWPRLKTGIAPTADTLAKKSETFPAADGRQLAVQVSAQGALLNAEDARFISTNYDSKVRLPEAYFEIKLPSGEWARMWSEMTRWNWFMEGIYSPFTNSTAAALSTKGEKEWGFFDAATGAPTPDGFLWASMPRIAICAGAAYQRIAEADGAYWVLESNGMVAEINGTTNGFFRVVDDEGKAQFEIVKGDKRTLFAAPGSMASSVMGITHYHVTYSVTNAVEAPVAQFTRSISEPEWFDESDSACPANVSWTKKDASTYVCEWWPKSAEPSMFMRAAFAVGGETRIVQTAPVEMQRIVIGGETYRITVSEINGKKVLTLE